MKNQKPMFYVVWAAVLLLIILHQDNWLWDNSTLAFGFLPVTLLYHVCISLAATITWWLATRYAWPVDHVHGKLTAEAKPQQEGGKP